MELKSDWGDICLSTAPGLDESWVVARHTGERVILPAGGQWQLANEDGWALVVSEQEDIAPIWCSELLQWPLYVSERGRAAFLDTHSTLPEQQDTARFKWLDVELDDWTLMSLTLRVGHCKSSLKFCTEVKALEGVSPPHFIIVCKSQSSLAGAAHTQSIRSELACLGHLWWLCLHPHVGALAGDFWPSQSRSVAIVSFYPHLLLPPPSQALPICGCRLWWDLASVKSGLNLSAFDGKPPSVWVHHGLPGWDRMMERFGMAGSVWRPASVDEDGAMARHARRPSISSVGLFLLLAQFAFGIRHAGRLPKDADEAAARELFESLRRLGMGGDSFVFHIFLDSAHWYPPAFPFGQRLISLEYARQSLFLGPLLEAAQGGVVVAMRLMRDLRCRTACRQDQDVTSVSLSTFMEAALAVGSVARHVVMQMCVALGHGVDQQIAPPMRLVTASTSSSNQKTGYYELAPISEQDARYKTMMESRVLQYWAAGVEASRTEQLLPFSFAHDATRIGGKPVQTMTIIHPTNIAYHAPLAEPHWGGGVVEQG